VSDSAQAERGLLALGEEGGLAPGGGREALLGFSPSARASLGVEVGQKRAPLICETRSSMRPELGDPKFFAVSDLRDGARAWTACGAAGEVVETEVCHGSFTGLMIKEGCACSRRTDSSEGSPPISFW